MSKTTRKTKYHRAQQQAERPIERPELDVKAGIAKLEQMLKERA